MNDANVENVSWLHMQLSCRLVFPKYEDVVLSSSLLHASHFPTLLNLPRFKVRYDRLQELQLEEFPPSDSSSRAVEKLVYGRVW